MSPAPFTLYGDSRSGNCYKAALLMRLLDVPFQWVETDVLSGATRTEQFLAMNPNGRVPLLDLGEGRLLAESNAILLYLAEETPYLPAGRFARAQVCQWLFFEQYSHEPYIAVARFLRHFDHGMTLDPDRMAMLEKRGYQALGVMDSVLRRQPFIAGASYSIADIALFAYTHVAGDGGFDLAPYRDIEAWMARIRRQPGHFDMEQFRA